MQMISMPCYSIDCKLDFFDPSTISETQTFVYANNQAAIARDTNSVTPVTHPNRVVCRTLKPKELIISEY